MEMGLGCGWRREMLGGSGIDSDMIGSGAIDAHHLHFLVF